MARIILHRPPLGYPIGAFSRFYAKKPKHALRKGRPTAQGRPVARTFERRSATKLLGLDLSHWNHMRTLGDAVDMRFVAAAAGESAHDAAPGAGRRLNDTPERFGEILAAELAYRRADVAPLEHFLLDDARLVRQVVYDQILLASHFGGHAARGTGRVDDAFGPAIPATGIAR